MDNSYPMRTWMRYTDHNLACILMFRKEGVSNKWEGGWKRVRHTGKIVLHTPKILCQHSNCNCSMSITKMVTPPIQKKYAFLNRISNGKHHILCCTIDSSRPVSRDSYLTHFVLSYTNQILLLTFTVQSKC